MGGAWRSTMQRAAGQFSAALSWLGNRAANDVGILLYHRLAERVPGIEEPSINVTPAQFRSQLAGLLQRGYHFWPLSRLLDEVESGRHAFPAQVAVLTFDDGHQSVFTEGFPILQELQIPATIFVNTAFLDSTDPFPFDRWGLRHREQLSAAAYRPLRSSECEEMLASGDIELGAHTHTHGDFRGRANAFQDDLQQSVDLLNERFGVQRPSFAFPFGRRSLGYVSQELTEAARRTGVRCALTTDVALVSADSDPFGWGRFNIYDWDTPATITARLRGWYAWAPRIQDRLVRWTGRAAGALP
jgi:peptidoglycan/xylan/chitin deacetylase (PgdA/CDA1 family)